MILGYVNTVALTKLKINSLYCNIRQQVTNEIKIKYMNYGILNDHDKMIFLLINVDTIICKMLGYFVCESFNIRDTCTTRQGPVLID